MTRTLDLTAAARADIVALLQWSAETFGDRARDRYAALIATGLEDIRRDPRCFGSLERAELQPGLRTYHLRHCRRRASASQDAVKSPRHFFAYRTPTSAHVLILRVLHDAMEVVGHLQTPTDDAD